MIILRYEALIDVVRERCRELRDGAHIDQRPLTRPVKCVTTTSMRDERLP